jgi:hypothetical protein
MVDGIVYYLNEDGRSLYWGDRHFVLFGPGPGGANCRGAAHPAASRGGRHRVLREGSRDEAREAYQVTTLVALYFLPAIIRGFALGLFIVAAVVLVAAPRPAQPTASRMAPARSVRRATLRAQQVEPHAHGTEVGRPPVAESTMKPRTPEERRRATERERQRLAKMTPEQRRQRRTLPSPEQRREYQHKWWANLTPEEREHQRRRECKNAKQRRERALQRPARTPEQRRRFRRGVEKLARYKADPAYRARVLARQRRRWGLPEQQRERERALICQILATYGTPVATFWAAGCTYRGSTATRGVNAVGIQMDFAEIILLIEDRNQAARGWNDGRVSSNTATPR